MIDDGAAPDRGGNPERERDEHRDEHRRRRQLDRRRHALENLARHRLSGAQRRAQIATHHALQEEAVLLEQRPIEAEPRTRSLSTSSCDAVSPSIACAGSPGIR